MLQEGDNENLFIEDTNLTFERAKSSKFKNFKRNLETEIEKVKINSSSETLTESTKHLTERKLNITYTESSKDNIKVTNSSSPVVRKEKKQSTQANRKVAGFWKQLGILTWKNLALSRRNICGLLTEILCPLFIIVLLIIIRYFVTVTAVSDQNNRVTNVLDALPITNNTNATLLLYYPNTTFIKNIISNAALLIKTRKPFFNPIRKFIFNNSCNEINEILKYP